MDGNTSTSYSGSPETFQSDSVGTFTYASFPSGWSDAAQVSPESTALQPSAVVIRTTDSFGSPTKALATFPAVALRHPLIFGREDNRLSSSDLRRG